MSVLDKRPIVSMQVTAVNGSDLITVTGNVNCGYIAVGSIVAIGAYPLYDAVSGTAPDSSGISYIKLARPWEEQTITDKMISFMAYEGLSSAVYELNVLLNKVSAERSLTIVYRGSYDLAGMQKLPTPATDTMEMWRILSAYTVDGISYSVGDLIYFDKYAGIWRTMWEAVGTAAKANLQESPFALTGRDVLRRSDFGIGTTITGANPDVTPNSTPAQILNLMGNQVHYYTKTLTINSENPEPKGSIKGYTSANPVEGSWQEFVGESGRAYRRHATSEDTWSVFTKVMMHGDVDTDTLFNLLPDTITFNSTPFDILNNSGDGAFYLMQSSSASGMPESKGSLRGYVSSTDNYMNSWQEYIGQSGIMYRRTAKSATEWNTYIPQLTGNDLVVGTTLKGRYEKRPDGTLTYWLKLKLQGANIGQAVVDSDNFPVLFIEDPDVVFSPLRQNSSGSQSKVGLFNYNGVYSVVTKTAVSINCHMYRVAIPVDADLVTFTVKVDGKWK